MKSIGGYEKMKKKLVVALLISSMMACMAGCGNKSDEAVTAQTVVESESTQETVEETSQAESSTEEKSGTEFAADKDFVLNTVDEEGNQCDIQTTLDYVINEEDGKKTYIVTLTYAQEEQKPFLAKVTAFDTAKLNIIKKFDDATGEVTEGTINIDDNTYNYSAVVEKEVDEEGVMTKETLTLTIDAEYDSLGLWIVAYEDKTHFGAERRYEIK